MHFLNPLPTENLATGNRWKVSYMTFLSELLSARVSRLGGVRQYFYQFCKVQSRNFHVIYFFWLKVVIRYLCDWGEGYNFSISGENRYLDQIFRVSRVSEEIVWQWRLRSHPSKDNSETAFVSDCQNEVVDHFSWLWSNRSEQQRAREQMKRRAGHGLVRTFARRAIEPPPPAVGKGLKFMIPGGTPVPKIKS